LTANHAEYANGKKYFGSRILCRSRLIFFAIPASQTLRARAATVMGATFQKWLALAAGPPNNPREGKMK
jgi:hypothetical protein